MLLLVCMVLMCPVMMFLISRAIKKSEPESSDGSEHAAGRKAEMARLRSQLAQLRDDEEARQVPRADV